jgi:hypothetical protein
VLADWRNFLSIVLINNSPMSYEKGNELGWYFVRMYTGCMN